MCKYGTTWISWGLLGVYLGSTWSPWGCEQKDKSHDLAIKPNEEDSGASWCKMSRVILKSKGAANCLTANLTRKKVVSFLRVCERLYLL